MRAPPLSLQRPLWHLRGQGSEDAELAYALRPRSSPFAASAKVSSFAGALTLPKGAGLHAVAADLHRAPLAGAVPGAVVKGPLASIVGTDLQPAPYPLVRGPHHCGKDTTKGRGHTGRFRPEHQAAILIETDPETHAPGYAVELPEIGRFDLFTIVGQEQGAYPFSQCEHTLQVFLVRDRLIIEQVHARKPAEQGVGALEFVCAFFYVPGVHEPADQLQVAWCLVSLRNHHIFSTYCRYPTLRPLAFSFSALRGRARLILRDPPQLQDPSPKTYPPLPARSSPPAAHLPREASVLRLLEQLFAVMAQYLESGRVVVHLRPFSLSVRAVIPLLLTTVNNTLVTVTSQ